MAEFQGDEDDGSLFNYKLHVADDVLRRRPAVAATGRCWPIRPALDAAELDARQGDVHR